MSINEFDGRTSEYPALRVSNLTVDFINKRKTASVLKDVSFDVRAGKTLCLVGESGCGKSMTALAILQLLPHPGQISAGVVELQGKNLMKLSSSKMRSMRGNQLAMIFQEPMTALNPVYTVGDQICEPLRLHKGLNKQQARRRAIEILRSVQIPLPDKRIDEYPHQLSGGMRQRAMIAMAVACDPEVLIADEPTTALDVTVQAQIFELLRKQQKERGTAMIMITHDMGAVSEMADDVIVMYGGRVVEKGSTDDVLSQPKHPYTKGLIACLPELDANPTTHRPDLPEIPGVVPSVWERTTGCPFADRCGDVMAKCLESFPIASKLSATHEVFCWLYKDGI